MPALYCPDAIRIHCLHNSSPCLMQTQQSREIYTNKDSGGKADIAAEADDQSLHPEAAHSKHALPDESSAIQNLPSQVQSLQVASLQCAEQVGQPPEADLQAAQDALNAEHVQQMSALKSKFECLLEEYTAKNQQVGCADKHVATDASASAV